MFGITVSLWPEPVSISAKCASMMRCVNVVDPCTTYVCPAAAEPDSNNTNKNATTRTELGLRLI